MKVIGDICYPTGKYQDRNTGDEKTRWARCGVLMQNDQGDYRIKLETIPFVPGEGWFSVFEPRSQQGQAPQAPAQQSFRQPAQPSSFDQEQDVPW